MTTSTIDTNSSPRLPTRPTISVYISTAAPTFDLSLFTPFAIRTVLTLHHDKPITFRKLDTPLFDRLLRNPGLNFTSTRTGKVVNSPGSLCKWRVGMDEDNLPTEANRDEWMTLFPEQFLNAEDAFKPMLTGPSISEMAAARLKSFQEPQKESMKWPFMHGFKDGEVYRIGVSDGAGVRDWVVGSLAEILELRMLGSTLTVEDEAIEFEVRETRTFEVRRPDQDGSLNWP